jgi:putative FmdB family regulatory protein
MLNLPTKGSRILAVTLFKPVEVSMPHYEFFADCNKFFDKILSLVDYEEGEVQCPHCGSKNVEQRWSAISAITSKKSA